MALIPKWVLWGAAAGLISLGILVAGPGISFAGSGSSHRFSMAVDPAVTVANLTGQDVVVRTISATATSGNQFACTGAGSCMLASAPGQNLSLDTGGGTATVVVGGTNATTTTIGRLGQTTNLNGNATFNTAGPNLGGTTTGSWDAFETGLAVATTNYGAFQMAGSVTNVKFRQVSCTHRVAGTGANGTLGVRNVTDGTTLCSGSYTCTTAANTPTAILDCNQTPLASKMYAIQFTTGCGGTQVTDLNCTVEIAH